MNKRNLFILSCCFFVSANCSVLKLKAQTIGWLVDSTVNVIDGYGPLYNNLHAGDTVYLKAGSRDKLLIRNFKGSPDRPITFMNNNGVVTISTNDYYGISIVNCRYIRFSGQCNNSDFYGIQINKVSRGSGIGVGAFSTDVEIDHVQIQNCLYSGIVAKTDPDCLLKASRDSFTQFNTSIHDNSIVDVGNEGMYIGSSFYSGVHLSCNGKDTLVMPAVLNNVKIYNNIVKRTGWDGIQVSSASLHCQIHHNTVINDSQAGTKNQMSGILLGGGSACDCYNNKISDGNGDGIEDHGLGGNKIYNNIIVNAGQSFLPNDVSQLKHGIFVSDVSVMKDSGFSILFNDIINPKSDGIRFQSIKSKHNLIASNLIVNPGNYNLYQTDNTSFTGNDAYVMIPNRAADVQLKNNFFSRNIQAAGISATDFTILPGSPLINKGYQRALSITTDFNNERRPIGGYYDIGALEYNSGDDRFFDTINQKAILYPNPVQSKLNIRFVASDISSGLLQIYASNGQMVLKQSTNVLLPGIQELQINPVSLFKGIYHYKFKQGKETTYGKFIKL
jgi:hypothetical protein